MHYTANIGGIVHFIFYNDYNYYAKTPDNQKYFITFGKISKPRYCLT